MRKILALSLVLAISGCASPYQEIGYGGGYYHQRITEDIYKVGFRGNGFTGFEQTRDFAFLRSAEICAQLGYTHFVIEGQEEKSKETTIDMGSTSYTSGSAYGYGDSISYYGTTNTYNNEMSVTKPRIELVARYFDGKPSGRYLEIFEAKLVIGELKEKYGLNKTP